VTTARMVETIARTVMITTKMVAATVEEAAVVMMVTVVEMGSQPLALI